MKLVKNLIIGTLSLGFVAGCSMTSEPYSIPLTNLQPKTFTYKKFNSDGYKSVKVNDAIYSIQNYIKANSAYQNCDCSSSNGSGITDRWGTGIGFSDESFTLTYYMHQEYSTGRIEKANVVQNFRYKLTETSDSISVELASPAQAIVNPGTNALGIPFKVGISDENVLAWTNKLFTSKSLASIQQQEVMSGEFNVDLDPESVKANFIREHQLDFSEYKNGVQWIASDTYSFSDSDVKVSIKLTLYRGKTKVEYNIVQRFALESDGSIKNYNAEANGKVLDIIKKAANS